jgi:hypothetical protein
MAADNEFESGRGHGRRRANHESGSNPWTQPACGGLGHCRRGFPRGENTAGVVRTFRSGVIRRHAAFALFALRRASPSLAWVDREQRRDGLHYFGIERPLDQHVSRARLDTGPDDGQEVVSKLRM